MFRKGAGKESTEIKFHFPECKKVPGKSRTEAEPLLLGAFLIPDLQLPGQQKNIFIRMVSPTSRQS